MEEGRSAERRWEGLKGGSSVELHPRRFRATKEFSLCNFAKQNFVLKGLAGGFGVKDFLSLPGKKVRLVFRVLTQTCNHVKAEHNKVSSVFGLGDDSCVLTEERARSVGRSMPARGSPPPVSRAAVRGGHKHSQNGLSDSRRGSVGVKDVTMSGIRRKEASVTPLCSEMWGSGSIGFMNTAALI